LLQICPIIGHDLIVTSLFDDEHLAGFALELQFNLLENEGVDMCLDQILIVEQERRGTNLPGDDPFGVSVEVLAVRSASESTATERRDQ